MEPKVANMLRRGNGNVIKEDRRSGLMTELEGDVGCIHLDTPLQIPALDAGEVDLRSGVRIRVTSEDTSKHG
jgi:hypothetical protein